MTSRWISDRPPVNRTRHIGKLPDGPKNRRGRLARLALSKHLALNRPLIPWEILSWIPKMFSSLFLGRR
jgi:hypothetical protein